MSRQYRDHCELTDDADRAHYAGCDAFNPADIDWEGVEYDDLHNTPKCGGEFVNEHGEREGCPGCRECSPPDSECKPYGFGIEPFEDPAIAAANAAMWAEVDQRGADKYTNAAVHFEIWGTFAGTRTQARPLPRDRELRDLCWRVWSKQSKRRHRHSEIVWARLCDQCESHAEAVGRYEAWARRAVMVRYRDEK